MSRPRCPDCGGLLGTITATGEQVCPRCNTRRPPSESGRGPLLATAHLGEPRSRGREQTLLWDIVKALRELNAMVRGPLVEPPAFKDPYGVYVNEQGYRHEPGGSRVTSGVPDLFVFYQGRFTWAELKAPVKPLDIQDPTRMLSPTQKRFRQECGSASCPWALWTSVEDALRWCSESPSTART